MNEYLIDLACKSAINSELCQKHGSILICGEKIISGYNHYKYNQDRRNNNKPKYPNTPNTPNTPNISKQVNSQKIIPKNHIISETIPLYKNSTNEDEDEELVMITENRKKTKK